MIWTILLFLCVLSVLVIVHEAGHFFAAKKMGMDVEEFGLGFPPRVFGWKDKKGMLWSLNAIPIGGFVRIKGESGDSNEHGSFAQKGVFPRLFVLVAGVFMNMVLALLIFSILAGLGVPTILNGSTPKNAVITDQYIMVGSVLPGAPADEAGIEWTTKIISVNGQTRNSADELLQVVQEASITPDQQIELLLEKDGVEETVLVTPKFIEQIDHNGIGVSFVDVGTIRYPWYMTPIEGVKITWSVTSQMFVMVPEALKALFANLFSSSTGGVAGPVGIAVMTGQVARQGFVSLLQFAGFLSVNLAIINAIPFPALDGGRMVFVALEGIRRKKLNPRTEAIIHNTGFLLLMALIAIVTYKDILNVF